MEKIVLILTALILSMSVMTSCLAAENNAEDFTLTMQIGNPIMTVNGIEQEIDPGRGTVPVIQDGRTFVPIRAIIEAMGGTVSWDQETQIITITKPAENSSASLQPTEGGKVLVVYYSATGSTKKAAEYIAAATDADIFEIEPLNPYTDEDLNWSDENSRVSREHENESERKAELKETSLPDWEDYDTVFIGYPIWWGIAAWPINGFVEANDFTGKTVIPFCTSASSGLGRSGEFLAEAAGTGSWQEGMRFRSGVSESEVKAWVDSFGIKTDKENID